MSPIKAAKLIKAGQAYQAFTVVHPDLNEKSFLSYEDAVAMCERNDVDPMSCIKDAVYREVKSMAYVTDRQGHCRPLQALQTLGHFELIDK